MIGWAEAILIVVLFIVLFSPNEMVRFARFMGRVYYEYQKLVAEIQKMTSEERLRRRY